MGKRVLLARVVFSLLFIGVVYAIFVGKGEGALVETVFLLRSNTSIGVALALTLFSVSALCAFPPATAIYIFCGAFLPTTSAVFLSLFGSIISFSFAYLLGRASKDDGSPLIMALSDGGKKGFFASFTLRAVRFVPYGSVGVYIGKARLPFLGYLLGSVVGSLPSIALSISLGCALTAGNGMAAVEFSSYLVAISTLKLFLIRVFVR